jgi:hypothetical protein
VIGLFLFFAVFLFRIGLYQYAGAFLGFCFVAAVPLVIISEKTFDRRRFVAVQALFGVGFYLIVQAFELTTPFSAVDSFEVGSFAMLVTTAFYFKSEEPFFRQLLILSISSTFFLFLGGLFEAIQQVGESATVIVKVPWLVYATSTLFLLGAFDLVFLSTLFFGIIIRRKGPIPYVQ